jgi:hypothetical protein
MAGIDKCQLTDRATGVLAAQSCLADLAARDELVVVYGTDQPGDDRTSNALVTGLCDRLPRYHIVPVSLPPHADGLDAALVESSALTVAVTAHQKLAGTAARLSSFLRADRVLKASYTLADGADLQQVRHRRTTQTGRSGG